MTGCFQFLLVKVQQSFRSLVLLLGALAALQAAVVAHATTGAGIELVVPFEAGSPLDELAQTIAAGLQNQLGMPVHTKNMVGKVKGKSVALEYVRQADPQRNVFLLGNPVTMVNWDLKSHRNDLPWYPGFAAISHVVDYEFGVVVTDKVAIATGAPDLSAQPSGAGEDDEAEVALVPALNYALSSAALTPVEHFNQLLHWLRTEGTPGIGVAESNMVASLLAFKIGRDARVQMKLTPFSDSRYLVAGLQQGKANVAIDILPVVWHLQKTAGIRLLAVSSERRLGRLPNVPTLNELGFGIDASGWAVVFASDRMPEKNRLWMGDALQLLFKDQAFSKKLKKLFFTPVGSDAENAERMVSEFTHMWAPAARRVLGAKP